MTEATVSITEVVPSTTRIARQDLQVGDRVFDVWGGTYAVTKVRQTAHRTTAEREDGETFVLYADETITVIKGEQA